MKSHELQLLLNQGDGHLAYTPSDSCPRIRKIRRIFQEMSLGRVILDVGCASGDILAPLSIKHEIHGVEISPELIERAKKNGIRAVPLNIENDPFPFEAGKFDAILCGETIEHLVDTDWLMFEINRVLKQDGKLVLTYPNIRTLLGVAMLLFFDLPPMYAARYRSAHFRDFTLRTIKMVLQAHGFRLDRAQGSAFYLPKTGDCLSAVATVFPSWASTVVIEATKLAESSYSAEKVIPTSLY